MSRKIYISLFVLVAAAMILTACAPAAPVVETVVVTQEVVVTEEVIVTQEVVVEGWLHSGDQARIDNGFITITGRIKDILVLANGEKVSPADMEAAIAEDVLFDQIMVIGEQMPYLTAIVVLNKHKWKQAARDLQVPKDDETVLRTQPVEKFLTQRVQQKIIEFPGYAKIRHVTATLEPWTVENDLITPTLKLKRANIRDHYSEDIGRMYQGHETFKTEVRRNT